MYKATDLNYHLYENNWDTGWKEARKWSSPPINARGRVQISPSKKYVALKRIYVTSSPIRILNELELLHKLRQEQLQYISHS